MLDASHIRLFVDFTSNNFNVWVNTILLLGVDTKFIYNQISALVSSSIPYFWHIG